MARNEREAKIRITGDAKGATRATKKAESGFKRLGNFLKKNMVAAAAATAVAFVAMAKVFSSVTEAAKAQENAVRALDAALLPLGASAGNVSKALQDQATALQRVTQFGDEQIIKGQALIASFTKNEEEIKKATAAALDLSAALGIELNASFLLLGKAASGETSTLSRYGIILDEGLSKSEKFAAALDAITDSFGGRAAEVAKTYGGLTQQISNAWGDLLETIGFAITKNESLLRILTSLRDTLSTGGLVDGVVRFAARMSDAFNATVDLVNGTRDLIAATREYREELKQSNAASDVASSALDALVTATLRFIPGLIELSRVNRETEKSQAALVEIQKKLIEGGGRLRLNVGGLTFDFNALAKSSGLLAQAQKQAGDAAGDAAGEFKDAAKEVEGLADAYSAAVDAASVFGEVTSVQLANQISAISLQLEVQKELLDEGGAEYQRYARIGKAQIESLSERIVNLRDGLGDLKKDTKDAADSFDGYGRAADGAGAATDRWAASNGRLSNSFVEIERAQSRVIGASPSGSRSTSSFATIGGGTFTVVGKQIRTAPDGRIEVF